MVKKSRKIALITGASSGIGRELAILFAAHAIDLILIARNENKLMSLQKRLQSEHPVEIRVLVSDLSEPMAGQVVFDQIAQWDIRVDYLINNAGVGEFGFFVDSDWQKDQMIIDLNIKVLTQLTKLFIPGMKENGYGRIMNVASTAAFQPGPLMAVYYASKAYVLSFSQALANELEDSGITVTALCPGPTESGFHQAVSMEASGLVKNRSLPTSRDVAVYGYQAMMRGKAVAIHGRVNWLLANASRLFPRKLVTRVVRMISEQKQ